MTKMKSANQQQAEAQFKLLQDKIEAKEAEVLELKELKRTVMKYIITFEGPCHECQNAHWPHCEED